DKQLTQERELLNLNFNKTISDNNKKTTTKTVETKKEETKSLLDELEEQSKNNEQYYKAENAERERLNNEKLEKEKTLKNALAEIAASKPQGEADQLDSLDEKKAKLIASGVPELEATEYIEAEKQKIRDKYDDLEKKQKQKNIEQGIKIAKDTVNAIQNVTDIAFAAKLSKVKKGSAEEEKLLKKQFQLNKKLQIAGAIIDGAKAGLASLAASPLTILGVPNPAGIAAFVATVTTSAAAIAKIGSTQFESSSSGNLPTPSLGGGGESGGIPSVGQTIPSAPTTSISGGGQVTNTQDPMKVYVLETDIKKTTNRVNVIENQARIG
ncbi:MAG: hypothetical protein WCJ33_00290, partial [Pseudomonadota bacterium]